MEAFLFIVAISASVFMGISIGSSSVAPAFAPVNISNSSNILKLALFAGISALIGSILQGERVAESVGAEILTGEIVILQAAIILIIGASLVLLSVITDYPMPTAFTIVGAVVGSGLAFGNNIMWGSLQKIVLFWILTPLAASMMGYIVSKVIRKYLHKEENRDMIRYFLLIAGCYVAYTAGAASVGLAVGPLQGLGYSTTSLLVFGGFTILLGAWMYSPRIIKAVSYDYSTVGPRRSLAALISSGILAQVGVFLGVPVSFSLAILPAIIGSGISGEKSERSKKKITFTGLRWISSFFLAMGLAYIPAFFL
ncbi:MAG: inorganic phosphate transporter [Candidatus Aenigmatarchaeota archaeon]